MFHAFAAGPASCKVARTAREYGRSQTTCRLLSKYNQIRRVAFTTSVVGNRCHALFFVDSASDRAVEAGFTSITLLEGT